MYQEMSRKIWTKIGPQKRREQKKRNTKPPEAP
jgi:hypothetical protein